MITVLRYVNESDHEVVTDWLLSLNDRQARARVEARFLRLATGNFGDCKPLREGVWELRIDWGTGIACITPRSVMPSSCCYAVATNENRTLTLNGLSTTWSISNGEQNEQIQKSQHQQPRCHAARTAR